MECMYCGMGLTEDEDGLVDVNGRYYCRESFDEDGLHETADEAITSSNE